MSEKREIYEAFKRSILESVAGSKEDEKECPHNSYAQGMYYGIQEGLKEALSILCEQFFFNEDDADLT